jgi:hypothetical protein
MLFDRQGSLPTLWKPISSKPFSFNNWDSVSRLKNFRRVVLAAAHATGSLANSPLERRNSVRFCTKYCCLDSLKAFLTGPAIQRESSEDADQSPISNIETVELCRFSPEELAMIRRSFQS